MIKADQSFTDNIITPCLLCRSEAISASNTKYCTTCYKELIINFCLQNYPVSGKAVAQKLRKVPKNP